MDKSTPALSDVKINAAYKQATQDSSVLLSSNRRLSVTVSSPRFNINVLRVDLETPRTHFTDALLRVSWELTGLTTAVDH